MSVQLPTRDEILSNWGGTLRYAELESRVRASLRLTLREADFAALALEIHAFQREWNEPYGQWCAGLPYPRKWQEIPAVPQAMFKRFRLATFPVDATKTIFRTSGTTGETRGEHHFLSRRTYQASILAGWRALRLPRVRPIILAPQVKDAPDSSLACMLHFLAAEMVPPTTWLCLPDGRLDYGWVNRQSHHEWSKEPVALLGTALAFLNFFENLESPRVILAPGSYAMETGGFKGSGRDIPKRELYAMFQERLGLEPKQVWNEYGMCELSSQFYTRGLRGTHTGGPWVRAVVVSPETGTEVPVGELGVLRIFDLANIGSVLAVQTADLAIRQEDGFELLGRDPAATPRGCSRPADETMRAANLPAVPRATDRRAFRPAAPALSCAERARHLAAAAAPFDFLGPITTDSLLGLVESELGHAGALDHFVPHGVHRVRALAPATILHILSGNTPAAALQSLLRGLLLGSMNLCKLPDRGIPEVLTFLDSLPEPLRAMVEITVALPEIWLDRADALIVFGSDETVEHFRRRSQPWQTFIAHGHKLSFGVIFDDPTLASVPGAARDVSIFDQQGCLSPHVFYVRESAALTASSYARQLAAAMADYEAHTPRGALSVSEGNSIRTLREEVTFRAANGEPLELHASPEGTAWTVIADHTAGFPSTPLNRVVFVKPLPEQPGRELARVQEHLSACGVWPLTEPNVEAAMLLGATRICPIGNMQHPALTWHQDGQPVLTPLVRWVDWEG